MARKQQEGNSQFTEGPPVLPSPLSPNVLVTNPSGLCCDFKVDAENSATSLPMARPFLEQRPGLSLPAHDPGDILEADARQLGRCLGPAHLISRLCCCPQGSPPRPNLRKMHPLSSISARHIVVSSNPATPLIKGDLRNTPLYQSGALQTG